MTEINRFLKVVTQFRDAVTQNYKYPESCSWGPQLEQLNQYINELEENHPPDYDLNFGDEQKCSCGHAYYRHFDTYDDMLPIGCKYCGCDRWRAP